MSHRSLYLTISLFVLFSLFFAQPVSAYYFGGKVQSWQANSQCPAVEASNKILASICGATLGVICLNINYGDLEIKSLTDNPYIDVNASVKGLDINSLINGGRNAAGTEHIGVLSINDTLAPMFPLYLYKSYLMFNVTKPNAYVIGQAMDFAPSCNPCSNDLLRKVLDKAGLNIDGACGNFLVRSAIAVATAPCNIAMKASSNTCPTKLMCYVGSSSLGLPRIPDINLCSLI